MRRPVRTGLRPPPRSLARTAVFRSLRNSPQFAGISGALMPRCTVSADCRGPGRARFWPIVSGLSKPVPGAGARSKCSHRGTNLFLAPAWQNSRTHLLEDWFDLMVTKVPSSGRFIPLEALQRCGRMLMIGIRMLRLDPPRAGQDV
jgi:hypothetical protein